MRFQFSAAAAVATLSTFTNVITVTAFDAVVGASGVASRLPVDTLRTQSPDVWNMYILGLAAMQAMPETELLSYYQLAGIHGVPFIPWEEPTSSSQDPTRGYCTHGSALFATWHRPYLVLIEQQLVANAISEAKKFSGSAQTKYLAAAQQVRLPYWDWAASDLKSHIPTVVMQPTIQVTKYTSSGGTTTTTINNPLYDYKFTDAAYRAEYFTGNFESWTTTRRQPDNNGNSQEQVADQQMANGFTARQQNTYNLFSIPSFSGFSNTDPNLDGTPNEWTSLESIHNEVHVLIGGNNGHMTMLAYSAFDPIFWLHHANVDRLTAMYQAINYGKFVTPQPASGTFARKVTAGQTDTVNTPLNPFKHPDGSYFTSNDVSWSSTTWHFGYEYPEVPFSLRGQSHDAVKSYTTQKMNALYAPTTAATSRRGRRQRSLEPRAGTERREYLCYAQFDQSEVYGSAEVLIFLDGEYGQHVPTEINSNSTYETKAATTGTAPSTGFATGTAVGTAPASTGTGSAFFNASGTIITVPTWSNATSSTGKTNGTTLPVNPRLSKTCIGEIASFADKGKKPMPHIVRGTVPLSSALQELGINLNQDEAVEYLSKHLSWAVMQGDTLVPLTSVPSLKVGVASSNVQYPSNPEELPTWGEFEQYYQVTHGKAGGMSTTEPEYANTTPANCVGGVSYSGSMPLPEGYEQVVKVVGGNCTCEN